MRSRAQSGEAWIWLTGGALAACVLLIVGLLALIATSALGVFWPHAVERFELVSGESVLGVVRSRERVPGQSNAYRFQLQTGNRDLYGADFRWLNESDIRTRNLPLDAAVVERREWGLFVGYVADAKGTGVVELTSIDGQKRELPDDKIVRIVRPNAMSTLGKLSLYGSRVWEFLSDEPRESNTEGGVFPALFGTVMMVLIMTVAVVPFGVLAALYLREYARQGLAVRIVRIAVNNLAGVPSIVFGIFGLGFFVYFIGGSIDALLFADRLPTPTFGTGGILWASLTLALLTVPVVVVSTEEALSAVPKEYRDGSLALGATKFETIWRVVLPNALPGILTGTILAMARGAGEVAPLMITGVVKLAPSLPVDAAFPFVHLDRKFMHLGFHIYDVGFQSPNVEAAKPMVYATALLLVAIVVGLNLAAILVRNRLRRRLSGGAF